MGEMADYDYDQGILFSESLDDCCENEHCSCRSDSGLIDCRYCGQPNLRWEEFVNEWRLVDGFGIIHSCSKERREWFRNRGMEP